MQETPIFQVDAFTARPFAGNSAVVCFVDVEREEQWMQSVAAEMNVAGTSFVLAAETKNRFQLSQAG